MTGKSNIEWTEQTWNPIVGCSIVSPGCTHCYAMKMAARIEAMGNQPRYAGTTKKVNGNAVWTGKLAQAPEETLLAPLRRKKPTTYFVNSMGDLFHDDITDDWIDRVFAVMALSPQHTFQVLTKRAKRMRQWFSVDRADSVGLAMLTLVDRIPYGHRRVPWPLPNVWLGVSTERQQEADERIPLLLDTPAAVRFISAEPLLGPIDLTRLCILPQKPGSIRAGIHLNALAGRYCESGMPYLGDWDVNGPCPPASGQRHLDWVIVGGESGPDARPMHPAWARSLRDQCAAAGVALFFKQWGEWAPNIGAVDGWTIDDDPEISRFDHREWEDGRWSDVFRPMWCDFQDGNYDEEQCVSRLGKKATGRLLDGVEHNGMPAVRS